MPDKSEILTGAVYPPSGIKQENILSRNIDHGRYTALSFPDKYPSSAELPFDKKREYKDIL